MGGSNKSGVSNLSKASRNTTDRLCDEHKNLLQVAFDCHLCKAVGNHHHDEGLKEKADTPFSNRLLTVTSSSSVEELIADEPKNFTYTKNTPAEDIAERNHSHISDDVFLPNDSFFTGHRSSSRHSLPKLPLKNVQRTQKENIQSIISDPRPRSSAENSNILLERLKQQLPTNIYPENEVYHNLYHYDHNGHYITHGYGYGIDRNYIDLPRTSDGIDYRYNMRRNSMNNRFNSHRHNKDDQFDNDVQNIRHGIQNCRINYKKQQTLLVECMNRVIDERRRSATNSRSTSIQDLKKFKHPNRNTKHNRM